MGISLQFPFSPGNIYNACHNSRNYQHFSAMVSCSIFACVLSEKFSILHRLPSQQSSISENVAEGGSPPSLYLCHPPFSSLISSTLLGALRECYILSEDQHILEAQILWHFMFYL